MYFILSGEITFYCDIVLIARSWKNQKDHHYKFGIFYHHKTNPKIWVPKADGLGWTLNFANKGATLSCLLF